VMSAMLHTIAHYFHVRKLFPKVAVQLPFND
jgi:hypothetical protein